MGAKWDPADLLPVNPSGDELQGMREALLLKRAAGRAAKKEKKKDRAAAAAAANGDAAEAGAALAAAANGGGGGKRGADAGADSAPAAAPAGAAAAAKRFKAAELKPKGADDKVWSSLFTSSHAGQDGGNGGSDYMTRGALKYVV